MFLLSISTKILNYFDFIVNYNAISFYIIKFYGIERIIFIIIIDISQTNRKTISIFMILLFLLYDILID